MRIAGAVLGLIAAVPLAPAMSTAGPIELRAASLAATCAACHGANGRALPQASVAGLAAMPASRLRSEMLAFKRGDRTGTVMPQLAKGFSDAQIDELATYFAAQPPAAAP